MPEADANALLIAAAPDLLAALDELTNCVFASGLTADNTDLWMRSCAAIAKATGQ